MTDPSSIVKLKRELSEAIASARSDIQDGGGNNKFYIYVTTAVGKRSGLSKANITYFVKIIREADSVEKLYQIREKVDFFKTTAEAFKQFSVSKVKNFWNTQYYLYFFDSRDIDKYKCMLGRAVLTIDGGGQVLIQNVHVSNNNYKGRFKLIHDHICDFDLDGENSNSHLHMKILMGTEPHEISTGSYLSYERKQVISGTLILEKRDNKEELKPNRLISRDKEFKNINPEIRKWLSRKSLNHLKVSKDILSLEDLENFNLGYRRDKRTLFFDVDDPIVYISSPTDSIPKKDDFKTKRQIILEMIDSLNSAFKEYDNTISVNFKYPGQRRMDEMDFISQVKNRKSLITDLEILKQAKFFILIYDQNVLSKSLIELGVALEHSKNILILYNKKIGFPELSAFANSGRYRNFSTLGYEGDLQSAKQSFIQTIFEFIIEHTPDTTLVT